MIKKKSIFGLLLVTYLVIQGFSTSLMATEAPPVPTVDEVAMTTVDDQLLLFTAVKNGLTAELLSRLERGIPLSFTFYLTLTRVRDYWFDETLVEQEVIHTLAYDALKEAFRVTLSEQGNVELIFEDRQDALRRMETLIGLPLLAVSQLEPDALYVVEVYVQLEEETLPLNLHYLIPFWSSLDLETAPRYFEFRY